MQVKPCDATYTWPVKKKEPNLALLVIRVVGILALLGLAAVALWR